MPHSTKLAELPPHSTLIIPGYQGSGPGHWQTWLERQLPNARRVSGIDWNNPHLTDWADSVRSAIRSASGRIWLVAHSFGCLAAVVAGNDLAARIAGAMLVAPGDPERFSPQGLRESSGQGAGIARALPQELLGFPSLIVASGDDPWMRPARVAYWADRWGSTIVHAGRVGHLNEASGFGPWPEGLALLKSFQESQAQGRGVPARIRHAAASPAGAGLAERRIA
ncbi:RBBP9/YdeN family alpha/beta hydrolase [Imhoffiella purpurea]|uniref:Putative esterase of the alpha/beta hydrolase fold protein n=1 Tax=Imhoffiella purpurea TaxID=1249627 RepID=W9VVU4_9GAMM|nr:alpha/beta hydrolase [Imhoffiella purpurea]EXJ14575.1 Putative esterase of the alpha/beta hydrolase fold protein [Imhoffiella purpurea]